MMTDHYEVEGSDERWCPQCVTKQRTLDKRSEREPTHYTHDMRTVRIRKTKYGFEIEYISADGKHVGCAGFSGFATRDMADSAAKWCDQTPDPTVEEKELTNTTFAN